MTQVTKELAALADDVQAAILVAPRHTSLWCDAAIQRIDRIVSGHEDEEEIRFAKELMGRLVRLKGKQK